MIRFVKLNCWTILHEWLYVLKYAFWPSSHVLFYFQQFHWTSCCLVDNWFRGKCSSKDTDPHLDPALRRGRNHHWAVGVGEKGHQNPGRGSCQNYPLKVKWAVCQPSKKLIDKAAWSDFISDFVNAFKRYGYATYVHNKR